MPDLVQASDPIIHHTFDAGEGVLILLKFCTTQNMDVARLLSCSLLVACQTT